MVNKNTRCSITTINQCEIYFVSGGTNTTIADDFLSSSILSGLLAIGSTLPGMVSGYSNPDVALLNRIYGIKAAKVGALSSIATTMIKQVFDSHDKTMVLIEFGVFLILTGMLWRIN